MPISCRVRRKFFEAVFATSLTAVAQALGGSVITDGSLGAKRTLSGPHFSIPATLGQIRGGNLFQSLETLNLSPGDVATFSGPSTVTNVLARVTGGQSTINGTLACSIPNAAFYLINPSGVVFGPDASLNVGGSFAVTTADYIKHADGTQFPATGGRIAVLSTAAPAAFGFLGKAAPSPVSFTATASQPGALAVKEQSRFTIVGGKIVLQRETLTASGGTVQISSLGSGAAIISLAGDASAFASGAAISLSQASTINVDGQRGGRVIVDGQSLGITDSNILARTKGMLSGGGIDVRLGGAFRLKDGYLDTSTSGAGNAGPVEIQCAALTVEGSASGDAGILSQSSASNRSVQVALNVDATDVGDLGATLTDPSGKAVQLFDVLYQTGEGPQGPELSNTAFSDTAARPISVEESEPDSTGAFRPVHPLSVLDRDNFNGVWKLNLNDPYSGDIATLNDWTLHLGNHVFQASTSASFASSPGGFTSEILVNNFPAVTTAGAAGPINILAAKGVFVKRGDLSASSSGGGDSGNIAVDAQALTLDGGSTLRSDAATYANEGNIRVHAESIKITGRSAITQTNYGSGNAGSINIYAGELDIDAEDGQRYGGQTTGGIFGETNASGPAAEISVHAQDLRIGDDGKIDDETESSGSGGAIHLKTQTTIIDSGNAVNLDTGVDAATEGAFDDGGSAGNIRFSADRLELIDNSEIRSATNDSKGNAGNISIDARVLRSDGGFIAAGTNVTDASAEAGAGGEIRIRGQDITFGNGTVVNSITSSPSAAGDIYINCARLTLTGDNRAAAGPSLIETSSSASVPLMPGPSGGIHIRADDVIVSKDAKIESDSGFPNQPGMFSLGGTAGSIRIKAHELVLDTGGVISARTFTSAAGGQIAIVADGLSILNDGQITAEANGLGPAGSVAVSADRLTLDQSIASQQTGIFAASNAMPELRVLLYVEIPYGGQSGPVLDLINPAGVDQSVADGAEANDGSGFPRTAFSDSASDPIESATPPLRGTYSAYAPLSFLGIGNPIGQWTLSLDNSEGSSAGAINAWSLDVGGRVFRSTGAPVPVSVGQMAVSTIDVTAAKGAFRTYQSSGAAGNIRVRANTLAMMNGSQISAQTESTGTGGDVTVGVRHSAALSNKSLISSSTSGTGDGGQVNVNSHTLTLTSNSTIRSQSTYLGLAGDVNVDAGTLRVKDGSSISASAKKSAGGNVSIEGENIELLHGELVASAKGNGGNLRIGKAGVDRPTLSLLDGDLLATSEVASGGNIDVDASAFFNSPTSVISATSQLGPQGTVNIVSPTLDISGLLPALNTAILSSGAKLQEACGMQVGTLASSFTLEGGNGLPPDPANLSASPAEPSTRPSGR